MLSHLALIQLTQYFQWYLKSIRFKFLIQPFFVVGTVAMITEKLFFSRFLWQPLSGKQIPFFFIFSLAIQTVPEKKMESNRYR